MKLELLSALLLSLLPGLSAPAQHQHGEAAPAPEARGAMLLSGMGSHRHPIATSSPEAQKFFDQGMVLLFGFNHEEAIRSFERAAELDPSAAMPHWGMAFGLGSNYNDPAPAEERLRKARAEVEKALALSASSPGNERAYIEALSVRYSADPAADKGKLARAYHAAMKALTEKYPDDLDAATFYAEAGMNLRPWKLWRPDGTPQEGTLEIVATLESVLKRDPMHPGANHYYIHAVEASREPEKALPSAARLKTLVPSAGHLVHMPAHIHARTGSYLAAEEANAEAAEVDRAYIRATGATGMYPVMYYNHNVHFQSFAAAMAGRYAEAKKSADRLYADVLPVVSMDPMLEGFVLQPMVVAVRFRKWDDIRKTADPGAKMPTVRAFWLYARGVAAAESGDVKGAEKERAAFQAAIAGIPAELLFGPQNTVRGTLAVAGHDLDARIAEARGDRKSAIESWRKAVASEDLLAYDEPPAWQSPMRESLGAALLSDGQAAEAEKVFRADLEKNPRNPRSLFGLAESLRKQDKSADAAWVQSRFETAWKDADTRLVLGDL
ncbi:MAG: tetratricopeptide repeat protein [Thermoanaerobaculia bacterium]